MPANLENLAVAPGLEKSVFIPIAKKGNVKKERLYPFEFRVPKNSKEMGKPSSVISPKKQRETIEWERL